MPGARAAGLALGGRLAGVSLETKAFDEIKGDSRIGRAEALRPPMLALIRAAGAKPPPPTRRPSWGQGEGGRLAFLSGPEDAYLVAPAGPAASATPSQC